MEAEMKPTVASRIALPRRVVELVDLKTEDGQPVRVLCERRDELFVYETFGLPGARVDAEKAIPKTPDEKSRERMANAKRLLDNSPALVHAATAILAEDGHEVRPAFHCDEAHAVPGSVPWALLSLEDKLIVVTNLLDLSGFGGAAEAEFPAQG